MTWPTHYNLQTRVNWQTWPSWRYLELGQFRKFCDVLFRFLCFLTLSPWRERLTKHFSCASKWMPLNENTFSIEALCQTFQCFISHEMNFEYCIWNFEFLFIQRKPIAWTIASIPVAAVTLRCTFDQMKPVWYKTLLWWDCCGEVAIQHCVICIQLKIQSNSFYKLYSKSKNVFRPVKIPLLSFLIGR